MNPGAQEDSIPQALSRARLQFSSDSTVDVSVYIQHGGCFGWAFLSCSRCDLSGAKMVGKKTSRNEASHDGSEKVSI